MEELLEKFKDNPTYCVCPSCERPYMVKRSSLNPDVVTNVISKYFGNIDLREKTRRQTHVIARQMAFKILHTYSTLSLKECAEYYKPATQDHTTSLHGIRIITDRIKYEDKIAEDYNNIIGLIIKEYDSN